MASAPNVLPIFPEPDRKLSLSVIAAAVRKTKFHEELTNSELAFELRCDPGTVENAEAERTLMVFDTVARLLRKYPQHCAGIRQLWELEPVEELTASDHLERAEHHLRLAQRMLK